jgi:hypothetical protein
MLQEKYSQPCNNSPKPGWKSLQERPASRASNRPRDVALKTIQLQEGDSSKTAVIGAGLDEK